MGYRHAVYNKIVIYKKNVKFKNKQCITYWHDDINSQNNLRVKSQPNTILIIFVREFNNMEYLQNRGMIIVNNSRNEYTRQQ